MAVEKNWKKVFIRVTGFSFDRKFALHKVLTSTSKQIGNGEIDFD